MVKKVTLDTLDIEENTDSLEEKPPSGPKEESATVKWHFSRRRQWACLFLAGLAMLAGLAWWGRGGEVRGRQPVEEVVVVPSSGSPSKNIKNDGGLEGFIIPLKEGKGGDRVMVCDLVVALDIPGQALFREKILDVRNVVYEAVHRKTAQALLSREGREALRGEIQAGLSQLLGGPSVKSLYFTKYLVL